MRRADGQALVIRSSLNQRNCSRDTAGAYLPSFLSFSRTFMMALPSLFSPHLSRFASAFAASNPTPQIRSWGDAYSIYVSAANVFWMPDEPTYLDQLPLTRSEQRLRHLHAVLTLGEFVVIALLDNAALVCHGSVNVDFPCARPKKTQTYAHPTSSDRIL